MNLTFAEIQQLTAAGNSIAFRPDGTVESITPVRAEEGGSAVPGRYQSDRSVTETKALTPAARQRAYRERRDAAAACVTRDVTRDVTNVTRDVTNVTSDVTNVTSDVTNVTSDVTNVTNVTPPSPSPSPSLPPPSSPEPPPSPTCPPPPPPPPVYAHEAEAHDDDAHDEEAHALNGKRSRSRSRVAFPLSEAVEAELRGLYRRKPTTPWNVNERRSAKLLMRTGVSEEQLLEDLALFRKTREEGWQFYRRDIFTLLNNWNAEVERCSDYLRNPNGNHHSGTPRQAPIVTRNTAPLPAGLPSLNDTDWRPARPAAGVPDLGRPSA